MKWPQLPKKLTPYTLKFTQHVARFLESQMPLGKADKWRKSSLSSPVSVAVSGGVDSVSLVYVIALLRDQERKIFKGQSQCFDKLTKVNLIHVNHKSRPPKQHQQEANALNDLAKQLGMEFSLYESPTPTVGQNELDWRNLRKIIFSHHAQTFSQKIFQGHHLDDSWEWSFLQNLKSSHPQHSLGIPFKSGPLIRPFLCVTKKQILHFARDLKIPYFKDETQTHLNFERNFLRSQITPIIEKRYPKYLKFYALQSMQKAHEYQLSWKKIAGGSWCQIQTFKEQQPTVFIWRADVRDKNSLLPNSEMRSMIEYLSNTHRGKHAAQLAQLSDTWRNHKSGPVSFSGGVEAKIIKDFKIIFYKRSESQALGAYLSSDPKLALLDFKKWPEFSRSLLKKKQE
ncbi:MAG: tRNA lysidine(34) synthetase TilS [Bacteriovoracaceae bacterium]|nr:tRNA lysidine(34) synthetase TilS [Bacteriovoracaceae bacterium]